VDGETIPELKCCSRSVIWIGFGFQRLLVPSALFDPLLHDFSVPEFAFSSTYSTSKHPSFHIDQTLLTWWVPQLSSFVRIHYRFWGRPRSERMSLLSKWRLDRYLCMRDPVWQGWSWMLWGMFPLIRTFCPWGPLPLGKWTSDKSCPCLLRNCPRRFAKLAFVGLQTGPVLTPFIEVSPSSFERAGEWNWTKKRGKNNC